MSIYSGETCKFIFKPEDVSTCLKMLKKLAAKALDLYGDRFSGFGSLALYEAKSSRADVQTGYFKRFWVLELRCDDCWFCFEPELSEALGIEELKPGCFEAEISKVFRCAIDRKCAGSESAQREIYDFTGKKIYSEEDELDMNYKSTNPNFGKTSAIDILCS